MKSILISLTLMVLTFTANAQKQGICGQVFWLSGNQMPGPNSSLKSQQGVNRELFIYKVTKLGEAEQTESFFSNIKTELVATTISHQDGSFKVKLLPGEYSVFVKEPKGLFANQFDQNSKINSIIVQPHKFGWMTISIDYEAAY